jgi:molybdopterin converting factor small subunit
MATVYIPTLLKELTGGRVSVEVAGETVREVIERLDEACPGIRARLLEGDRLRPNVAVAVDGEISPTPLLDTVGADDEIHFVFAINGG